MVSRGGRSKGCTNCRRRRVKCDENRPVCDRCKKRGLDCDGPKDHTFINHTPDAQPGYVPAEVQRTSANLLVELSLAAFYDELCLAYTRKVMLKGGPAELACEIAVSSRLGADVDPSAKLLRDSVMSLAITYFGIQHHQAAIQAKGYSKYGTVLKQLNTHLGIAELQTTDLTLLSALICMLMEVFLPTGPLNFLKHLRGIEMILEMRGVPEDPVPQSTLVLLYGLRTLSIVGGLVMARPSLFSRPEWQRLPNLSHSEGALLQHHTLDVMANCTRYMGEGARLLMPPSPPEARQPLLAEVEAEMAGMEPLRARWVKLNSEQMVSAPSRLAKETNIANQKMASTYMHYNAAYIILLDLLKALDSTTVPGYASLRNAAALEIIDCLKQKTSEKEDGAGASNTIGFVATKVAWQALGGFHTPAGRRLACAVQEAIGGVFAVNAFEGPTVELGSPCQLWHQLQETQKPDVSDEEEDGRWPLLSEFGPTTVIGDALATTIIPWLRRVR